MLTRAAPGGATYFMLVGDAGDGHGGAARGVHERSRDKWAGAMSLMFRYQHLCAGICD